jgi:putative transposase
VLNAFKMACQTRGPLKDCVFHSDQGVQYVSLEFRQAISRLKVVQSMGRKGDGWDSEPLQERVCPAQRGSERRAKAFSRA